LEAKRIAKTKLIGFKAASSTPYFGYFQGDAIIRAAYRDPCILRF